MIEHYTTISLFKPKKGVLCNCLSTLEDAISLMEDYTLAVSRMYLIMKALKRKGMPNQTTQNGRVTQRDGLKSNLGGPKKEH